MSEVQRAVARSIGIDGDIAVEMIRWEDGSITARTIPVVRPSRAQAEATYERAKALIEDEIAANDAAPWIEQRLIRS